MATHIGEEQFRIQKSLYHTLFIKEGLDLALVIYIYIYTYIYIYIYALSSNIYIYSSLLADRS